MWHDFDPLSVFILSGPLIILLIVWLSRVGFGQLDETDSELSTPEELTGQRNFCPVRVLKEDHE